MRVAVLLLTLTVGTTSYAQPPSGEPDAARIRAALGRYAHEPTVHDVVATALRHAALRESDIEAALSRARASGLLPLLRVGVRRGTGRDEYAQWGDVDRARLTTDAELALQGWLTFDLRRIVYAPDEPRLFQQQALANRARADTVRLVIKLYFERRRLQIERDLGIGDRLDHEIRILEADAWLDQLTGGRFGRDRRRK